MGWRAGEGSHGNSQDRGNSGVFLQGQFEIQVLDNYNNPTYPDGQCGAVYGQTPPLVNACKKPAEWQSYDIFFTAARWDDNHQVTSPAYVTVIQNGILVQNHQPIIGPTGHRILANYKHQLPETGPLGLQDHGNPIRYRNVWIRSLTEGRKAVGPRQSKKSELRCLTFGERGRLDRIRRRPADGILYLKTFSIRPARQTDAKHHC